MHVTEADDLDRPVDADADLIEVDFVAADGSLAGWLRLDARRPAGATSFLAAILVAGEDPVVVIDHDLPLATSAFEFRAPGVWVEFCCESPLDHWTIGLEAFGLRVDPSEVITPDTYGERVPVGLDLDLDTTAAPTGDASAFSIDIRAHGEILIADRAWEIDAPGTRSRVTTGVRHPLHLEARPVGDSPIAELSIGWPDDAGTIRTLRRGWIGGSRPGWVDLSTAP